MYCAFKGGKLFYFGPNTSEIIPLLINQFWALEKIKKIK